MGWESGISLAAAGVKSVAGIQTAKAETSAIAETAENQASNIANKTSRNIGSLESSFLKGGIALGGNGTGGPSAFFQQAGAQGTTDIQRTIDNANANISNVMNSARTSGLETIASAAGKIPLSSVASAWNGITGNPDPSPGANDPYGLIAATKIDTSAISGTGTGSIGGFGTASIWSGQ